VDRAVFLNYRGADSHSYAALLYTELIRQFGEQRVFLDAESIPAGADFVPELLGRVRSAPVLLAVIGPSWLTATDASGARRIDDPADWIRLELGEAFAAGVRVVPILTDQAALPRADELPGDIVALSRCQFRRLRYREPVTDLARIVADLVHLDPGLAAAARPRVGTPRQLPAAPVAFTGRARELAALTTTASTAVVISAIGGTGGIGKTALALHWAYHQLHRFPDGQLYTDLRGFDPSGRPTPASEVLRGFLTALGVDPTQLPDELDAQAGLYRSMVAGRRLLIVLDNARDVQQVTPLLPGSPTCTVLVTSRHHLTGLTLHGAALLDLDVLAESDAHDLLGRLLAPDRLAAQPRAVAELLAVCGGLPLAVRIVAARAADHPTFPLDVLAGELRQVTARLDGLDAGDQHTSLRAVLSWSVRALSEPAMELFGLVGIAPGPGIGLPAAARLADRPEGQTQAVLRELEHASLIQQDLPGRYRMHDLVRLYATETAHHARPDAATERLLQYYLATTGLADEWLRSVRGQGVPAEDGFAGREEALAWLDTERANLIAAVVAAADTGRDRVAVELAARSAEFLDWRRHVDDWLRVTQVGVQAAQRMQDPHECANALNRLGIALREVRRFAEAITAHTQARDIYRETGDRHGEGQALGNLGNALHRVRRFEEAITAHTQARDIFQNTGDRLSERIAWNNLGNALREVRRFEEAITAHSRALEICRDTGDRHGESQAWNNLGNALQQVRRFEEAITAYTQASDIYGETGDRHGEAQALGNLGVAMQQVRQFEEAIAAHTRAAEIYWEMGDRFGEGQAWNNLGIALQEVRRFEEAITAHTRAVEIYQVMGDRHGEGTALGNLGNAVQEVRRFEEAIAAHTRAVEIYREMGDRHGEGHAWNNLGIALREVRRFEEAIAAHTRAVDVYQAIGDRHGEGTAWYNLGIALREVRPFEDAITAHTRAVDIYREIGDRHGEGTALGGLGMALQEVDRRAEARDVWQQAVAAFAESGDEPFAERIRGWLAISTNQTRNMPE
jgi:tetratricopeptide (TPR) repeat protein